jgi:hypothetical protein
VYEAWYKVQVLTQKAQQDACDKAPTMMLMQLKELNLLALVVQKYKY